MLQENRGVAIPPQERKAQSIPGEPCRGVMNAENIARAGERSNANDDGFSKSKESMTNKNPEEVWRR